MRTETNKGKSIVYLLYTRVKATQILIGLLLFFLLAVNPVEAALADLNTSFVSYYSFDVDGTDSKGSNDAALVSATIGSNAYCGYGNCVETLVDNSAWVDFNTTFDTGSRTICSLVTAYTTNGNGIFVQDGGGLSNGYIYVGMSGGQWWTRQGDGTGHTDGTFSVNSTYMYCFSRNGTGAGNSIAYINGVKYTGTSGTSKSGSGEAQLHLSADRLAAPSTFWSGVYDIVGVWSRTFSQEDANTYYNNGDYVRWDGNQWLNLTPPQAFSTLEVRDRYDNSTIGNLTVYIGTDSNTTDAFGLATVYNPTGVNYTVDGSPLYFNTSGTAVENDTAYTNVYGAFVTLRLFDVEGTQINTFNVSSGNQFNSTTNGTLKIILAPNTSNTLEIAAPSYTNLTTTLTTVPRDLNSYNISGIAEGFINITAVNTTGGAVNSFTINWTGLSSGSDSTTSGSLGIYLNFGSHTFVIDSAGFALQNTTINIVNDTMLYEFVLPPPYLNLTFYDEVNQTLLNNTNISVSLIGSSSATNYTVTTGVLYLPNLAFDNYTVRYGATDYGVREFYVDLAKRTNVTEPLYLITDAQSLLLPITVTDFEGRQLGGAVVHWQRYYTSESAYVSVEMTTTSASGESNLYFEAENAWYKPVVYYQDFVNSDINGRRYSSADASNGVIFRIDITENPYESWLPVIGLIADNDITYNSVTRQFSYTYSDGSGVVSEVCLRVYNVGRRVETLLNSSCSSASSATLVTGHVATNNTIRARAELETNTANSPYTAAISTIESYASSSLAVLGGLAMFVTSMFIATMALLSGAHPAFPIVFGLIGMFGAWFGLGLAISQTAMVTIAIIGLGLIMLMSWRFNR